MSSPQVLIEQDLIVELDCGHFWLDTANNYPDLASELLLQALDSEGIAEQDGLVVVVSPHQNNFAMPLRVEVWDAAPHADLDAWQEAFEVDLRVDEYGIVYSSPTTAFVELAVPSGSYRALITGRGFVGTGWPGSVTPGDEWRIRLWPNTSPHGPVRLRPIADQMYQTPASRFAVKGTTAVRRLHAAYAKTATQPGAGTVVVERRVPGNRHQLFDCLRDPSGWLVERGVSMAGRCNKGSSVLSEAS